MGKTAKFITYIVTAPFIFLWAFAILLNIPVIQQYVKEHINRELSKKNGMELKAGNIRYSFPCNIEIKDFVLANDERIYASGETMKADLPLTDIISGRADVNSILLENVHFDTSDLFASSELKGHMREMAVKIEEIDLEDNVSITMESVALNGCRLEVRPKLPFDSIFRLEPFRRAMNATIVPGRCIMENCHFDIAGSEFDIHDRFMFEIKATIKLKSLKERVLRYKDYL